MYKKLTKTGYDFGGSNDNDDDDDVTTLNIIGASDPEHVCYGIAMVDSKPCGKKDDACENKKKYICLQPPMRGNCSRDGKVNEVHYFYNKQTNSCGVFAYTGCGDGGNNFVTYADCMATCKRKLRNKIYFK
jgi:hypothetical protein